MSDDDYQDFPVDRRSNESLERDAASWRRACGLGSTQPVGNMISLIESLAKAGFEFTRNLEIIVQPDQEMRGRHAYALRPKNAYPRIFVAKSIYDGAREGDSFAVMTMAHELGHIVLHGGCAPKARSTNTHSAREKLPSAMSAEHQAGFWAAAFLMPEAMVRASSSVDDLARRSGASRAAAEIRSTQLGHRFAPRAPIREVEDFLAHPRRKAIVDATDHWRGGKYSAQQVKAVWNRLPEVSERAPTRYRDCGGWCVALNEYRQPTQCGWSIRPDGTPIAFLRDNKIY